MFGVSLRGLLEEFHTWTLVFQRNAWFDCGFMLMRQTTEAGFAGDFTPRAVLSSLVGWLMMLGIMAGMVRMDSYALGSDMFKAVLLVAMHLALCSLG